MPDFIRVAATRFQMVHSDLGAMMNIIELQVMSLITYIICVHMLSSVFTLPTFCFTGA